MHAQRDFVVNVHPTQAQDEKELRMVVHYEADRSRKEIFQKDRKLEELHKSAKELSEAQEAQKRVAQSEAVGLRTALKVSTSTAHSTRTR